MTLADLASGPALDVAVIGGGVNGAGVARSAALAGLRVALFERDDFGSGTTWRSTKLVHGGLRYLEHGDLRLVRESLRERERLLRERPWLVRPLRFVVPGLPWSRRPSWQVEAGLSIYDLLAGRSSMPRHRRLSRSQCLALIPALNPALTSGLGFFDARLEAPERLAIDLIMEAADAGAHVFNHASVTAIETDAGRVRAITVGDGQTAVRIPVLTVVNAAGPWADIVSALVPGTMPVTETTRGTHLMLDLPGHRMRAAVLSTARSDGRVFFAVPRGDLVLVGTTDRKVNSRPEDTRPTQEDLNYLLAEAELLFPGSALDESRVAYAFAGLRSLARSPRSEEGSISRRLAVVDSRRGGGPSGFLSVVGGKLTTFRSAGRAVLKALGSDPRVAPDRTVADSGSWAEAAAETAKDGTDRSRLAAYGPALAGILALGRKRLCEECGLLEGEVLHAVRREKAATAADVVARRTGTAWRATRGLCCHDRVVGLMSQELDWNETRLSEESAAYRAFVSHNLPLPQEL